MSVWAIARVKDEADIICETVRQMAHHVDRQLIADNGSTDGTRELLEELAKELDLIVVADYDVGYYQERKMSALAEIVRRKGARWIVPYDADEVWRTTGRISALLDSLDPNVLCVEAQLLDHVATGQDPEGPPVERMGWRRTQAAPLRKVAVRAIRGLVIHQGNHSASFPGVIHPPTVTNALEVRHFPYRSVEQFVRKVRNGAAAYAATDLPEGVGSHWRGYGRILDERGEEGLAEVFHKWFWRDDPTAAIEIDGEAQAPLVFDPCPALKSSSPT